VFLDDVDPIDFDLVHDTIYIDKVLLGKHKVITLDTTGIF